MICLLDQSGWRWEKKIEEYCSHRDCEDLKVFKISQDETRELTYAEAVEYDKECTWEDEGIAIAFTPLQAEYLGLLYGRYIAFGYFAIAPHYDDRIIALSIEHI